MNKLLASFALLAFAFASASGTPNESVSTETALVRNLEIKRKLSMGPRTPSFKYFLLDRTSSATEAVDTYTTNDSDNYSIIQSSDLSTDAHSGYKSLKLDNASLGIRFGYLADNGKYNFSFWAKKVADGQSSTRFSVRFDNYNSGGERAWYASMATKEIVNGWTHYSYDFVSMVFERPSLTLSSYGSFLVDDITLTDESGTNYIMDGDFDDTELLGYRPTNAGLAKQSDGSVIFGFNSYNSEYNKNNAASNGYNEAYFEVNPSKAADSCTVSFEFCGARVGICNRNGSKWNAAVDTTKTGVWESFSQSLTGSVISSSGVYIGLNNASNKGVTYVRNISFKDAEGNELLGDQLTKEGYAKGFAESLANSLACDGGLTAPSASVWGDIRYCFERIPAVSQEYIKSLSPKADGTEVEQALYKYSYIISKYGDAYYDYLGYRLSSKTLALANNGLASSGFASTKDERAAYIVSAVGVAALALAVAFAVTKRKRA